jgi:hypothetical protein
MFLRRQLLFGLVLKATKQFRDELGSLVGWQSERLLEELLGLIAHHIKSITPASLLVRERTDDTDEGNEKWARKTAICISAQQSQIRSNCSLSISISVGGQRGC